MCPCRSLAIANILRIFLFSKNIFAEDEMCGWLSILFCDVKNSYHESDRYCVRIFCDISVCSLFLLCEVGDPTNFRLLRFLGYRDSGDGGSWYEVEWIFSRNSLFSKKIRSKEMWTLKVFNNIHNIAQTIHNASSSGKIRKTRVYLNRRVDQIVLACSKLAFGTDWQKW